jgi:phosphoribosylformylglycinamidine synthase
MILEILKKLITSPNLASKKSIIEQYDSEVMNDTLSIKGDAAVVRIHNTNKAIAISTDCTPRYVEADSFFGAMQAVVETYRNISAVGATPLAITNCLNFGNPQKEEIMGQIVRSIQGINEACKFLDYPVVSGNVSLYNETDGKAIKPTPAIGGVGLLKDLTKRCDIKLKNIDDVILLVGENFGHLGLSIYQEEITKNNDFSMPKISLIDEKKNAEFIRELIADQKINACHDLSDGGLLVAVFEMCSDKLGCDIEISDLLNKSKLTIEQLMFAEDQARYLIATSKNNIDEIFSKAREKNIEINYIAKVIENKIKFNDEEQDIRDLRIASEEFFAEKIFN